MTRTKSIIGTLLLSTLGVCACGAANASALTLHECTHSGGGTGKHYEFSSCTEESTEGTFETAPLPVGKEVELEATLTATTAGGEPTKNETAGTHLVLHFKTGSLEVQVTCIGFESPVAKVKNVEEKGGARKISGTAKLKFHNCAVAGSFTTSQDCTVSQDIETVELSVTTEGDKVVFKPVSGSTIFTMTFMKREGSGEGCPITGEKIVTGTIRASVASPTALEFTSTSGSELTVSDPKLGSPILQLTAVTHFGTKGGPFEEGRVAIDTP